MHVLTLDGLVIVLSLLNLIMLKQQLQQKLQQKLSPQQIQLIRLLELPAIELEERIKHELEDNPALEEGKEIADDFDRTDEGGEELAANEMEGESETDTDLSLGDYMSEDDIPDYKLRELNERAEKKEDVPFSVSESLNEYLLQQLGLRDLPEKQVKIAEYIIGNIDDDGYLRRDLSAIADDLVFQAGQDVTEKEIETVLAIIQDFDPAGVGARNLQECLLLQLARREKTSETRLATLMLTDFFEEFTRKHYDKIIKGLDIDETALKRAIREITTLDPKPCASWGGSMETALSQIIPDFVVEAVNGELILSMNNRGIPDMRINREYAEMFQDYAGNKANQTTQMKEAVQFVKQKLDSAQWFIDAIKQRQETLQRTMETIILLQRDFFLTGSIGDIYGKAFIRDEAGSIVYGTDGDYKGLPLVEGDGNTVKVGNANPDFMLGWNHSFSYKGFSLYFLLDWRYGGEVLSQTQAEMDLYGVSKATAQARDKGYVSLEGQQISDVKGFYKNVVGGRAGVTEYYMYDATNLRLREISLSYSFPRKWVQKTNCLKDLQLSFVARNLCFLYKKAPFDPDLVLSTGNDNQGIEVFGMPTTRSLGFTLTCEF